jgi:hypothetical protein
MLLVASEIWLKSLIVLGKIEYVYLAKCQFTSDVCYEPNLNRQIKVW